MQRVFATQFPDGTVVQWKPLTWSESRQLAKEYGHLESSGAAEWLLHEAAAALCVLDSQKNGEPIEFEDLYAGDIWIVGAQIINETGFLNVEEKIKDGLTRGRNLIHGDWYEEVSSYIMYIFDKTESEVKEWDKLTFMRWAARAELVLNQEFPIQSETQEEQKGIDFDKDNREMREAERKAPEGDFNLKRQGPQHPARQAQEQGKKVHPLRKKMMDLGMI